MIKPIDEAQGRLRDEFVTEPQPVEGQAADPPQGETASAGLPSVAAPLESSDSAESVHGLSHDEQNGLSPRQSEIPNPQSEIPNSKSDVPLLTQEERRQILARLARVNPLDCFDESGAFDLDRARRVLPPGSISRLTVHETSRPNAEGQPVTERRIDVGLFNPVAALRLDEQMERRRERDLSTSSSPSPTESGSNPDSPPPSPHTPEYGPYLLRLKTRGLEEVTRTLAN